MISRPTSLRLRMVISFLLVSVPPMLASAYFAASLISTAFEANVEHWLGETSRFFRLEVHEATQEAERVAEVIGLKLESGSESDLRNPGNVERDFTLLGTVGYDMLAVYDGNRKLRYTSRDFTSKTMLPLEARAGLFEIQTGNTLYVMAGAVRPVVVDGQTLHLLVGTWLDEVYLAGIKVVTSLDVRLYARTDDGFVPIMHTDPAVTQNRVITADTVARLQAANEPIFDPESGESAYKAILAGMRDVNDQLIAFAYIGLKKSEGFFESIGRWRLFSGIFLLGSALSIIVGTAMSGVLVRPLRAVTAGVRAITAGDYHQRVPEQGSREVVELAAGFNTMAEQLSKVQLLEEELRRRDRLSTLGQAAAVIAHEIRNPLGIIKTSTEVVRNRARIGPAEDKMLGYVVDEVRRIETLVRDFLEYSQPKAPVRSTVVLRTVVDQVAAFAAPELNKHEIKLHLDDQSAGATVAGDADQLHQACLNLILNAIDVMPCGGTLRLALVKTGSSIHLSVSDTGPGVPRELIAQIFNPFFTTKAKGTGLGLAKVQAVASSHGGTILYAPTEAGGATFTMVLPCGTANGGAS